MLTSGTRLGAYEIIALLGSGGMGDVYKATDTRLGREVAVKVLPPEVASDAERVARFEREARAVAALNHPNILALFDVGVYPSPDGRAGQPFLVTELLEGATLRVHAEGTTLPVRTVVGFAVQIATGLAAAHEKNIVHRDLKPENVFVTTDGRIKILDFGLAKLTQPDVDAAAVTALPTTPNTMPGVVMGTAGYMAPEQVRGLPADHRADIFALGTVVYELLAGTRAFTGDTGMDVMMAVAKETPAPLATLRPDVPPALVRVVERCMEKNPAARFQSTRDLVFALEGATGASAPEKALPGLQPPTPARRGGSTLPWLVAALATAAAVATAVMAGLPNAASSPALVRRVVFDVLPPEGASFSTGVGGPRQAISPDGRGLVVAAGNRLWLRSLDSNTIRALDGTEGAADPFWSPDNQAIGFVANGQLRRLMLANGLVTTLTKASAGTGASWGANGTILLGQTDGGLMQVPAAGGTPTPVTELDRDAGEQSHRFPEWLPGGRSYVYFALGNGGGSGTGTLLRGTLESSARLRIGPATSFARYSPTGHLVYTTQDALVAHPFDATSGSVTGEAFPIVTGVSTNLAGSAGFGVSDAGVLSYRRGDTEVSQLTWLDRAGVARGTLGEPAVYQNFRLSPDGARAVAVIGASLASGNVWVLDAGRGVASRVATSAGSALWAPDSQQLAYVTNTDGRVQLQVSPLDGSAGRTLALPADRRVIEDWSPDGQSVVTIGNGLWAFPLTGSGEPRQLVSERNVDEPVISRDGRWLAYASRESGEWEVYVRPFQGSGEQVRVSNAGGTQPKWRPDGRELFYLTLGGELMVVPVEPGGLFRPGRPTVLFKTSLDVSTSSDQYDVTGDGQRILMMLRTGRQTPTPITVIVNWATGLGR